MGPPSDPMHATLRDALNSAFIVFLGLAVTVVFMMALSGNWFWERHDVYYIRFGNARDLSAGRAVRYAGIQVGRVLAVNLDDRRPSNVTVKLGIRREFVMLDGMVASITQRGVIGESFVSLEMTSELGDRLPPGSWLPARETPGTLDIASTMGDLRLRFDRMADRLEELADQENLVHVREILANVAEITGEGNRELLRETLKAAPELQGRAGRVLTGLETEARKLSGTTGKALDEFRATVKTSGEELSRTLAETRKVLTETRERSNLLLEQTRGLAEAAKDGLAFDQERVENILESLDRTSSDLNSLTRSLRERPWLLLGPATGAGR